jgi:hypothetical protein
MQFRLNFVIHHKANLLHQKYVSASFSLSLGGNEVNGKNSSVVAAVLLAAALGAKRQ